MSNKNYQELQAELVELENALDGENNQEMRSEIEVHIAEVKELLANYDLSDDDLFQCQRFRLKRYLYLTPTSYIE